MIAFNMQAPRNRILLPLPVLAVAVLLVLFPRHGLSQSTSQSQTLLRATTRLVILDVVATDEKGQAVTDLRAEDFTVLEDGKPQQLIDFSFQRPTTTTQAAIKPASNVVSNAPEYSSASSLNVILLDAINTDFSSHAYAQEMLIKYLDSAPVIQPTAVYALDGKLMLLHDFSTDTKALREVLTHFKPQGPTYIPDVYAAASPFSQRGSFQVSSQGRNVMFNAMRFLAHSLAGYPGRKNLIWLSEGFPLSLFPETTMGEGAFLVVDFSPEIEKIADELMNAQVALYPIDAAGVSINDRFPARTAMVSMAERTGGKTFYNRNDIDAGVRTSIDDGSIYYNMQYYPQNKKWDNRFRKIEVKVNRPRVHLQYRQGYFAIGPDASLGANSDRAARDMGQALMLDAPASTSVLFQAGIAPPSDQTHNKYVVNFGIDPHTIHFQRDVDGFQHAEVGCVVWAYHGSGPPIQFEGPSLGANLKPAVYDQIMKSYFPCQRPLDLKRGDYTLRLGVIDLNTNLIGTVSMKLTVP
ncbi:MAG TPA: VWA domain-containing protein [Candidatus Angelobacter sp.]